MTISADHLSGCKIFKVKKQGRNLPWEFLETTFFYSWKEIIVLYYLDLAKTQWKFTFSKNGFHNVWLFPITRFCHFPIDLESNSLLLCLMYDFSDRVSKSFEFPTWFLRCPVWEKPCMLQDMNHVDTLPTMLTKPNLWPARAPGAGNLLEPCEMWQRFFHTNKWSEDKRDTAHVP